MEKFMGNILSTIKIKHFTNISLIQKAWLTFDKDFIESNVPIWILFSIIFINGFLNIYFSLFYPLPYYSLFTNYFSVNTDYINKTFAFLTGLSLIYISFQILNNKISAWYISLFILIISSITNIIRISSWYSVIIPLLSIIILLLTKKKFVVKFESNIVENNLFAMVITILIFVSYGVFGFLLLGKQDLGSQFSIIDSFSNTILTMFYLNVNSFNTPSIFGSWFIFSLQLTGLFLLLFSAHALFRPLYYTYKEHPEDLARAENILQTYGNSSLDYFKLMQDKNLFFSSTKQSFLAYKVKYSTAICLGDPSGPEDEFEKMIVEYKNFCKFQGWKIAFHHVKPSHIDIYKRIGFNYFKIGEEATVEIQKFVESTSKHSDFKRPFNKFTKEGFYLEIKLPPHDVALLQELKVISDEWLSTGRRERSFTLGNFNFKYLQTTPLILLKDKNNKVIAFFNRIKSFIPGEVTIDLMRHKRDIPNGCMDFFFDSYLQILNKEGLKTFSLGLSPFTGINESVDSPFIEKVMEELFDHFNMMFSFKGLRYYKEKFEPRWEDRYFVYNGKYISFFKIVIAFMRITEI